MSTEFVSISGLWLRKIGNRAQVLIERAGTWYLVGEELENGAYSHIWGVRGIEQAIPDPVTERRPR